jgi:hypothetical protein
MLRFATAVAKAGSVDVYVIPIIRERRILERVHAVRKTVDRELFEAARFRLSFGSGPRSATKAVEYAAEDDFRDRSAATWV